MFLWYYGPWSRPDECVAVDCALEDLAARPAREVVDDHDDPRVLVGREPLLRPCPELVGVGRGAGSWNHQRGDLLAEPVVRDSDDGGLEHVGMLVQHFLDLARIDVVARRG